MEPSTPSRLPVPGQRRALPAPNDRERNKAREGRRRSLLPQPAKEKDEPKPKKDEPRAGRIGLQRTNSKVERPKLAKQEAKKPAFTTFQQNFSPKKAPREAPPESSPLQMELLQLHLMHKSAALTNAAWAEDVESTLQVQFNDLAVRKDQLAKRANEVQSRLNLQATQVLEHGDLETLIQRFSLAIQRVDALLHEDGEYARLVGEFERWSAAVWDAETALSKDWHAGVANITRKLLASLADVEVFAAKTKLCFLSRLSLLYQQTVQQSLDELRGMEATSRGVLRYERELVGHLAKEAPSHSGNGIWQHHSARTVGLSGSRHLALDIKHS